MKKKKKEINKIKLTYQKLSVTDQIFRREKLVLLLLVLIFSFCPNPLTIKKKKFAGAEKLW